MKMKLAEKKQQGNFHQKSAFLNDTKKLVQKKTNKWLFSATLTAT